MINTYRRIQKNLNLSERSPRSKTVLVDRIAKALQKVTWKKIQEEKISAVKQAFVNSNRINLQYVLWKYAPKDSKDVYYLTVHNTKRKERIVSFEQNTPELQKLYAKVYGT